MKQTKFRKSLSILLSVIMLVATCAISFGVSVSAEDDGTSAVEAFVAYSITEEAIAMFADMVESSSATTGVLSSSQKSVSEDPYINFRIIKADDYDTYLFVAEWIELAAKAAIELVNSGSYSASNYETGNATDGVWNTASIRVALAYKIALALGGTSTSQSYGEVLNGTTYYTCLQFMNIFSIAGQVTAYNPTTSYSAAASVDKASVSYCGLTVTTSDVNGYLDSDEDMGLVYTLSYESPLQASGTTYVRYLDDDDIIYGVDYIPVALSASADEVPLTIYSTATTNSAYIGSCGESVYYTFDSSTGTLTIYGEGAMYTYAKDGTVPWLSYMTSIKSVVIEEGVTSISAYSFYTNAGVASNLTGTLVIPSTVTSIGASAFSQTGLTTVLLGENTTLAGYAFGGCASLTTVAIPASITTISATAFNNDTAITTVYYFGDIDNLTNNATTSSITTDIIITAPFSENYLTDTLTWKIDANYNLVISGTDAMPDYTSAANTPWYSSYNSIIQGVIVEEGVTYVGANSFRQLSNVTSITLPENSLESIGAYSFLNMSSMSGELVIPDSVTSLGAYAFHKTPFTSVVIGSGVTEIPTYCFHSCTALETIVIPGSVTLIVSDAFTNCTSLTTATYYGNIDSLENHDALIAELLDTACGDGIHYGDEIADDDKNYAATCSATGWAGATKCAICDETISAGAATSMLAHTWSTELVVMTEATCTHTGTMAYQCTVCGDYNTEGQEDIPTNGSHVFDDTYTINSSSNCTVAGTATGYCTECNKTVTIELELDPTVHVDENENDRCDLCSADLSEVDYDSLSFIDKIMLWINELIAAITALFSGL